MPNVSRSILFHGQAVADFSASGIRFFPFYLLGFGKCCGISNLVKTRVVACVRPNRCIIVRRAKHGIIWLLIDNSVLCGAIDKRAIRNFRYLNFA